MSVIQVNGIACYHEDVGTGEPVLLLHGGCCSVETMRPQVDALSRRHRVVAPERPGHGRSPDREGPVTFAGIVSDTVAYLDTLGIEDCHVVEFRPWVSGWRSPQKVMPIASKQPDTPWMAEMRVRN